MDMAKLDKRVADIEGGEVNLPIAQISEVRRAVLAVCFEEMDKDEMYAAASNCYSSLKADGRI